MDFIKASLIFAHQMYVREMETWTSETGFRKYIISHIEKISASSDLQSNPDSWFPDYVAMDI